MTDSEKLNLILEKISTIDQKITGLEKDMVDVKTDLRRLHRDDSLILDEVERVHDILDKHKADTTKHTA
ncbi:MAG: hypothetical protein HDQ99_02495 [Lachnospiraceae bacterium]|nr:hypothetical protein [Lachnospiraceae bacterium]